MQMRMQMEMDANLDIMELSSIFDQTLPSVPTRWVDSLFIKMQDCYGNRFLDQYLHIDLGKVKVLWGQQMYLLNANELRRGVAALLTREWPPSLAEFIKMCKLVIDPEAAYFEALKQGMAREAGKENTWSSPAIFWAWKTVGGYEFRTQSYTQLKGRWSRVLADECAKGEWPPIPSMLLQLGADMKSTSISARGVEELDKAIHEIQRKQTDDPEDHLRWAKEIEQKQKRGESVPLIASKMAQEALGSRRRHRQAIAA